MNIIDKFFVSIIEEERAIINNNINNSIDKQIANKKLFYGIKIYTLLSERDINTKPIRI